MTRRCLPRAESGTASIEFALILLPFSLLLLGIIDYGWYFYVDLVCTSAVRDGARTASTYPGACPNTNATTAGTSAVRTSLAGLMPSSYAPTITPTCTTVSSSPQFTYSLQLDFPQLTGLSLIPMPGGVLGSARVTTAAVTRGTQ